MKQYLITIINKDQCCGNYRVDSHLDLTQPENYFQCIEDYGFLYEPENSDVVNVVDLDVTPILFPWQPQLPYYYNPMKHKFDSNWSFEAEPNEDREGMQVFVYHRSGDGASLSCADNEGETCDGLRVPRSVVNACYRWIEQNNIDY